MNPNRSYRILILTVVFWMASLACQLTNSARTPTAIPSNTVAPSASLTATRTATTTATPTATPTLRPTQTATTTPTDTPLPPSPTVTPSISFQLVDLSPSDGDFAKLLSEHTAKARQLGLVACVEFHATWCPACQEIAKSLEEQNTLMLDAFHWVYLIRVDVDEWNTEDILNAGFDFQYIPVFFLLDASGQPTGAMIDGNAWGENIPDNMAPPIKNFFKTNQTP